MRLEVDAEVARAEARRYAIDLQATALRLKYEAEEARVRAEQIIKELDK